MKLIPCYCTKEVEFDFPEEVDLAQNPEVIDSIIEGTFMSVQCPYCGKLLKPEESVRIFDSKGTLDIRMIPELQRNAFLSGRIRTDAIRIAVGFPELVEKLAVYLAGLDEGAVEILKLPGIQREETREVTIYFDRVEADSLVFHVYGLEPGKVGVTKLSRDLYERTLKALKTSKDPLYREITTPPYISVKKVSREGSA